jgi:uncharacterized membrane protein YbhN (UPF0104 family)
MVTPLSLEWLPVLVEAFALSWLAGFVAPGAPAGLGVREGVLVALLGPLLESALVLQIVVAFRLATLVGDFIALALGVALRPYTSRRAAVSRSPAS